MCERLTPQCQLCRGHSSEPYRDGSHMAGHARQFLGRLALDREGSKSRGYLIRSSPRIVKGAKELAASACDICSRRMSFAI